LVNAGDKFQEKADTIKHVADEAWLVTKLAFKLVSYMGVGWRWAVRLLQMCAFVAFLMPAFLRVLWWYLRTDTVHRNIAYGRCVVVAEERGLLHTEV
jgi:prenylcysteine alpha-carboxyl methylesterase